MLSKKFILSLATTAQLLACAEDAVDLRTRGNSFDSSGVPVLVSLDLGGEQLALATSATAFSGRITCDGGVNLTVTTSPIELYGAPTNCKFKLDQFTVGGVVFNYVSGYTNFAVNEIGLFSPTNDPSRKMNVKIRSQLPSPLATASVRLEFSGLNETATVTGINTSGAGFANETISVTGETAPALTLTEVDLVSLTATTSALEAKYQCATNITGTSSADAQCAGELISDLRFAIELYPAAVVSPTLLTGYVTSATAIAGSSPEVTINAGATNKIKVRFTQAQAKYQTASDLVTPRISVVAKFVSNQAVSFTYAKFSRPLAAVTGHRIFVSSNAGNGNIGGLAGGDTRCQTLANAVPGLGGTWKFLASTTTVSAASRVTLAGPVYNMRNEKVADQNTFFSQTDATNAVKYDELGNAPENFTYYFTGTNDNGGTSTQVVNFLIGPPIFYSCNNWTSALASDSAWNSYTTSTKILNPGQTLRPCNDTALRILCLSTAQLTR